MVSASNIPSSILNKKNITIKLNKIIELGNTITIKNSHNIIIDGSGSYVTCTNPTKGLFSVEDSSGITFKNFKVDYKTVPHVAGKILSIDKKREEITFEAFSSYHGNISANLSFLSQHKTLYLYPLTSPGRVKESGTQVSFIKNILPIKNRQFLFKMRKIHNNVKVNDIIVIVFRTQGSPVFKVKNSSNIVFKNINIFSSPAAAMTLKNVEHCKIDSCKIILKRERWISTNADVIHFQSSRGDINITNNFFEGAGDDIINLYTIPLLVKKQQKNKILLEYEEAKKMVKKGDAIVFFNKDKNRVIDIQKVQAINYVDKGIWLTFKRTIHFNKKIWIYNKNLNMKSINIYNNHYLSSRRHGIFLKGIDVNITKNSFSYLGGNAIAIYNTTNQYREGLFSENIIVKNNNMKQCGYGLKKAKALIVVGDPLSKKRMLSLQTNISIKHNILKNKNKLFQMRHILDITIEN